METRDPTRRTIEFIVSLNLPEDTPDPSPAVIISLLQDYFDPRLRPTVMVNAWRNT